MKLEIKTCVLVVLIFLFSSSCSNLFPFLNQSLAINSDSYVSMNEDQIVDIVWAALEPNTSSHNQSNWEVVEAQLLNGGIEVERFVGDPAPGCWSGPEPPENESIGSNKIYWLVFMVPKPATPKPFYGTPSPTAPPFVPEPFLKEAYFLIDPETGGIVARKLLCVIY